MRSLDYLRSKKVPTTNDLKTLQERTFYGKEKKSLAYVIAIMNMILHGIEAPNVIHANTLAEDVSDIQEKNRFEVVLANPAALEQVGLAVAQRAAELEQLRATGSAAPKPEPPENFLSRVRKFLNIG